MPTSNGAIQVLAAMLTGVSHVYRALQPDQPDASLDEIQTDGEHGISCVMQLPSGDRYSVRVEWLRDVSP